LRSTVDKFRGAVQATRGYRAYRQSALYNTMRNPFRALQRLSRLPPYLGSRYQCPICRIRLRAYKAIAKSYWRDSDKFGAIYAPDRMETLSVESANCPSCNALDRERLIALFLKREFDSVNGTRRRLLIEFAPNDALPRWIKRHAFIAYRSADLSRKSVDERIDLTAMSQCADQSVDIILCSHVLEHIPEDRAAMREIARVLKPDGFAVLLVPLVRGLDQTHEDPTIVSEARRWKYFGMGDHVRQYGRRDFLGRLSAAGLMVDQLGIDYFGAEAFRSAGLTESSILYVARPAKFDDR
jgi:SAM-dependent methyltransferase